MASLKVRLMVTARPRGGIEDTDSIGRPVRSPFTVTASPIDAEGNAKADRFRIRLAALPDGLARGALVDAVIHDSGLRERKNGAATFDVPLGGASVTVAEAAPRTLTAAERLAAVAARAGVKLSE